jgi:Tfp pilus assembly protein PilO
VLTGESWSEAVARPLIFQDGSYSYVSAVYFVTFILLCGIVLINVAVAVLLEKMVDPEEEEADDDEQGSQEEPKPAPAAVPADAATIAELRDEIKEMRAELKLVLERLAAAPVAHASSAASISA